MRSYGYEGARRTRLIESVFFSKVCELFIPAPALGRIPASLPRKDGRSKELRIWIHCDMICSGVKRATICQRGPGGLTEQKEEFH